MSYNFLDKTGLAYFWSKIKAKFDSFSRNDLAILDSKEYSGIYGSANDQASASFYFGTIRPTNWYNMWKIRFKVYASVPNQNNYRQYSDVTFYGNQTEVTYKIENKMYSTSNRCYYYVNLCKLNATGYNAGYSYIPGINLRSSNNPTSSSYPRTFKIEILETENCTFTFYDAMKKVANIAEYSTTNYVGISEYDGANNGLRETGDDTNIWQLRHNSGNFVTSTALYRYMLLLQKNETTLVPLNAVNNSTATTKTLTTDEFNPFGAILYYNSTSTINANASVGAGTLFEQIALDLRYSFNTGTTLTAHKDVFIIAVPQSNGKAKLYTTPITQTLPTTEDGLIYIHLGRAYSTYQIELYPTHPVYQYKNGSIKLYSIDFDKSYSTGSISSGTIDDLAAFTAGKPGITGSISLVKKDSGIGNEIPAGWYNYFFSPHRTGLKFTSEDNDMYGTIILTPMTNSGKSWILRRSSSSTTITEVKSIVTSDILNSYVTTDTTQTITGAKTLNSTLTMSNINNATYTTSTTGNIIPSATGLANPPWNKDLWHDHFALLRYHTIESKEVTNDGTTWNASSLDINSMFLGKDSASVTVLAAANLAFRFVLKNSTFAYSGVSWFELGVAYTNPFSNFEVLIEFSSDKSTWTTCHQSTITSNSSPFFLKNNTSFSSDGYIRVTFTKKTELTTGTVRIGCLKALCIRKGDQGLGSEYEYPYDWDINSNLLPIANNTKNLGSNNQKWANVYATTFNGNATSATKATQDSDGNAINTTYYKASNPNGYTSNTGTVTSVAVKMNGTTKGTVTTSGTIDLGTVITDISGKQDTLVSGTNIKTINNTSLLGSGNINISGGQATDVQINGTSIVSSNTANLVTNTAYNASTNKLATMEDVNNISGDNKTRAYRFTCSSVIPGTGRTSNIFVIDINSDIQPNTFVYDANAVYSNVTLEIPYSLYSQCSEEDGLNIRLIDNNQTLANFTLSANGHGTIMVDYLYDYSSPDYLWKAILDTSNYSFLLVGQSVLIENDIQSKVDNLFTAMRSLGQDIQNYCEFTSNKVTSISSSSTDIEYPSALAVYNYVNDVGALIYKGTLGAQHSTISSLPDPSDDNKGFVYIGGDDTNVMYFYTRPGTQSRILLYIYEKDTVYSNGVDWIIVPTARLASQSVPGLMDLNDKIKLDGIDSGAQVNAVTDIQVGGTSILSNKVANLVTNTAYNATTNKIATMSDIPSTITTGTGTVNTTYISAVENNHWERVGHIVSYSFTMTVKGTWTSTTQFISGLPKPVAALRFLGVNHSANTPLRLQLNTNGQILHAWSTTIPANNYQIEGHITYITNE